MLASYFNRLRPTVRRWAWGIGLLVLQAVVRAAIGLRFHFAVELLIGGVVAIAANWLTLQPEQRRNLASCAKDYVLTAISTARQRIHDKQWWKNLAIAVGRYLAVNMAPILLTCFFVALSIQLVTDQRAPQENFVQEVLQIVERIGPIAAIVIFSFMVISGRWTNTSSPVVSLLAAVSRMIAAYGLICWLIGRFGDGVYQYAIQNPTEAAVIVAAALVVFVMLRVGLAPVSHVARVGYSAAAFTAGNSEEFLKIPATKRDVEYVAAHEAGHALIYAALGKLPVGLEVTVLDYVGKNGILGFVSGIKQDHQLLKRQFVEWQMLVLLAGKYGELVAFGEVTIGGGDDQMRWARMATQYLDNHVKGLFYNDPQTDAERKHNAEKLELLRMEQEEILRTFFEMNVKTFTLLRKGLEEKKKVSRDELVPYMQQVVLPQGFPLPVGTFETFSAEPMETVELPMDR